jgi:hypothetical protein
MFAKTKLKMQKAIAAKVVAKKKKIEKPGKESVQTETSRFGRSATELPPIHPNNSSLFHGKPYQDPHFLFPYGTGWAANRKDGIPQEKELDKGSKINKGG